jgi:hypothetical protein
VEPSPLLLRPPLAYCTSLRWWWMCEAIGGMIGRGNRNTQRKPASMLLCPTQIPHAMTRARTRTSAVGSRRLTVWARHCQKLHLTVKQCTNMLYTLGMENWYTVLAINTSVLDHCSDCCELCNSRETTIIQQDNPLETFTILYRTEFTFMAKRKVNLSLCSSN